MRLFRNAAVTACVVMAAACGTDGEKTNTTPSKAEFKEIEQDYESLPQGLIARVPVDQYGNVLSQNPEIRSYYGNQIDESNVEQAYMGAGISDLYGENAQSFAMSNPLMLNVPNQFLAVKGKVGQYPGQNPGKVGQHPVQNPGKVGQYPGQYPGKVGQYPRQYPSKVGQYQGKGGKGGKGGVVQSPWQFAIDQSSGYGYDYSYRLDLEISHNRSYNDYFMNRFRPIHRSRYYPRFNWGYYTRPRRWISNGHCYYLYRRPVCSSYRWCNREIYL